MNYLKNWNDFNSDKIFELKSNFSNMIKNRKEGVLQYSKNKYVVRLKIDRNVVSLKHFNNKKEADDFYQYCIDNREKIIDDYKNKHIMFKPWREN